MGRWLAGHKGQARSDRTIGGKARELSARAGCGGGGGGGDRMREKAAGGDREAERSGRTGEGGLVAGRGGESVRKQHDDVSSGEGVRRDVR